jgi:hypothetical protein
MELFLVILQIFGLLVLALVVIALAARGTLQGRAARRANKAARIGVEAPARRQGDRGGADDRAPPR